MSRRLLLTVGVAMIGWIVLPSEALACAVCYGDPDSGQVIGLNRAIWLLLAVVGVVQIGFVAMFAGFIRRSRRSGDPGDAATTSEGVAE